jgi:hypothetical protein
MRIMWGYATKKIGEMSPFHTVTAESSLIRQPEVIDTYKLDTAIRHGKNYE